MVKWRLAQKSYFEMNIGPIGHIFVFFLKQTLQSKLPLAFFRKKYCFGWIFLNFGQNLPFFV